MKAAVLALAVGALCVGCAAYAASGPNARTMNKDLPLNPGDLPHAPSFAPASGSASVCQSYAVGDWHYKVRYVYKKADASWSVAAIEAKRLRFANGTPMPRSLAGKADPPDNRTCPRTTKPKPPPDPMTAALALFCHGCDPLPAPTPAVEEIRRAFPPPPNPGGAGAQVTRIYAHKHWIGKAAYTWEITNAAPRGTWRLTGFLVMPKDRNKGDAVRAPASGTSPPSHVIPD